MIIAFNLYFRMIIIYIFMYLQCQLTLQFTFSCQISLKISLWTASIFFCICFWIKRCPKPGYIIQWSFVLMIETCLLNFQVTCVWWYYLILLPIVKRRHTGLIWMHHYCANLYCCPMDNFHVIVKFSNFQKKVKFHCSPLWPCKL